MTYSDHSIKIFSKYFFHLLYVALEFTGGVPFDIIKPVLERATADQLFMLEHYNPYLVEDTDKLWQYHCNREFRNKQREEMETWREMYMVGRFKTNNSPYL